MNQKVPYVGMFVFEHRHTPQQILKYSYIFILSMPLCLPLDILLLPAHQELPQS